MTSEGPKATAPVRSGVDQLRAGQRHRRLTRYRSARWLIVESNSPLFFHWLAGFRISVGTPEHVVGTCMELRR